MHVGTNLRNFGSLSCQLPCRLYKYPSCAKFCSKLVSPDLWLPQQLQLASVLCLFSTCMMELQGIKSCGWIIYCAPVKYFLRDLNLYSTSFLSTPVMVPPARFFVHSNVGIPSITQLQKQLYGFLKSFPFFSGACWMLILAVEIKWSGYIIFFCHVFNLSKESIFSEAHL